MNKKKLLKILLPVAVISLVCGGVISNADEIETESKTVSVQSEEDNIYIRGNHPREDNIWLQYFPLSTALRKNVVISDVITPDSQWENWNGDIVNTHSMKNENAENYDDSHNHYQNFLSEVLNFSEGTNAVAVWGDSSAVVNGSKAWGGFFSARANAQQFSENEQFSQYIPNNVNLEYNESTYDTQLIGIEVDVLNGGLPGVYPNMSKTGVQIVGFGNPNSMAIEVRSEDTDKDVSDEERRGVIESGIYFKNSIAPYGRLLVSDLQQARIGLDLKNTLFTEGALQILSQQVGTGIIYNDGASGEIYGGQRWDGAEDQNGWLTLRAGEGGIRIVSNDNTKELVAIDNYGGIYLNGDVYLNGQRLSGSAAETGVMNYAVYILCIFNVILLCGMAVVIFRYLKMKKNMEKV